MGLSGKHLLVTGNTALSTAAELIRTVVAQEHKDVIIVFWGSSVTQADADRLQAMLEAEFPLADLGFVEGRQDIYDFIISLE
jgi:dihydroxyacetone kinase-like predicted kinase